MTKEQRIELMNFLKRLDEEADCHDCLFYDECEPHADCIFGKMLDLIKKDGEQYAVQVVRCKDCKYSIRDCHNSTGLKCDFSFQSRCVSSDWFCANGKLKDGEQK